MQKEIQKKSKEIRKVDYFLYEFSIFFQNSMYALTRTEMKRLI